jgi:hypothetical protein
VILGPKSFHPKMDILSVDLRNVVLQVPRDEDS